MWHSGHVPDAVVVLPLELPELLVMLELPDPLDVDELDIPQFLP